MVTKVNIRLKMSEVLGIIVSKTLEFSGVSKSNEEVMSFCDELVKDEALTEALLRAVVVE